MKGFRWCGDLNGHKNPITRKYVIPDATAIEKGEPVNFTRGTGIIVLAAPTDFDDRILGVSMVEKAASDGKTELEVSVSPTALYKYKCSKTYTMTGGSTTTAVDSSLVPATNSFWKGGKIKIVSCAADSSLNGRKFDISDSTGGTGTLTLAETLPVALASGDTYKLCPGKYAVDHLGYDLDSDAMNPDWDADGGEVLRIFDVSPETMEVIFLFSNNEVTV